MHTGTLQEFLRSLGGTLGVVGISAKPVEDLRLIAQTLEPFKDLSLEQFADFLKRAALFRQSGDVPAVSVAGVDEVQTSARKVSEAVLALGGETDDKMVETQITHAKKSLQTALETLTKQFGVGLKFTEDKKWLSELTAKKAVSRVVESFRLLAPKITSSEDYQSDAVTEAVDKLATTDAKVLKAAIAELQVTGSGSGKKLIESVLAKLSGIDSKPAKAGKTPKAPKEQEATASEEDVEAVLRELKELLARGQNPEAVADSEIDTILVRLSTGFSTAQQKAIAKEFTGKSGSSAQSARTNIKIDLTAVKRLRDSQRV